ncbi:M14 family metallopeptidase [Roseivirga echinicomitans]
MKAFFSMALLALFLFSCDTKARYELTEFDYAQKHDTNDQEITPQKKRSYSFFEEGITADNLFDGARMNNFSVISENHYQVEINPENTPINPSAWYAFRVFSENQKTVEITLKYGFGKHRYWPKVSIDRRIWVALDSTRFTVAEDEKSATINLILPAGDFYIAAQEVINSTDMLEWTQSLTADKTQHEVIGKSKLGRDLLNMDITNGSPEGKDIVVVLSRQHPPEVTGNLAMMAFLEEIVNDSELSNKFLDQYRVIVYPMLNPDGVDLGHWRHNTGGVDLNRDWAYYLQPEIEQVCSDIIEKVNASGGEVKLGLDFHSTFSDVYYTYHDTVATVIQGFSNDWIENIFERVPQDQGRISAAAVGSAVSKNWFYSQFKAEGITYEIGDDTPRDLIKEKGKVSAQEMMELLLGKYKTEIQEQSPR